MVGWFSGSRALRPSEGSLLHRWLSAATPQPGTFVCGVRVLSGAVPGEGSRWRYRRSAVDPLIVGSVVRLNHGTRARLRLVLDGDDPVGAAGDPARPGFVVLGATEQDTAARLQLCVSPAELFRFGIDAPL